jgi:hypothetical protein
VNRSLEEYFLKKKKENLLNGNNKIIKGFMEKIN